MPSDEQTAWLESVLGLVLDTVAVGAGGPGGTASPVGAAAPEALADAHGGPQVGTTGATIRIINGTGSDLKLVSSTLLFPATARFAPSPPAIVPGRDGSLHTDAFFAVVDPVGGSAQAGGTASYHVERRATNSFFSFSWSGGKGNLAVQGDGPFSTKFHGETDSEAGDFYEFIIVETGGSSIDDLEVSVHILNNSGADMTLVQAVLDDPAHAEFNLKPPGVVPNKASKVFTVQAFDRDHPAASGTVTYQVPGAVPHTARMSWIRDGQPKGAMAPNDGAFAITSGGSGADFDFTIAPSGGAPPVAGGDTTITVVNNCGFELGNMLEFLENPAASFKTKPPETIANGASATFEVVAPDPHAPETDGTVSYGVDFDDKLQQKPFTIAMEWAVGAAPKGTVNPPTPGFAIQATQSGDSITFTVTGAPLDFKPPAKPGQPTLRQGDKSPDGWVEYLQESLNHHIKAGLKVDGDFGRGTHAAVIAFQTKHKADGCMVDGIVGNQTWALLREGAPEKPATDGRKPHSFEEGGLETRWLREHGIAAHDKGRDAIVLQLVSVGDIDATKDRKVRVRVTAPDTTQVVRDFPIGPPLPTSATGAGAQHEVLVTPFSTLFSPAASPPGEYVVESFFDQELGGDSFSETVTVAP